jgi:hypothetical protein
VQSAHITAPAQAVRSVPGAQVSTLQQPLLHGCVIEQVAVQA